jgi:hypothetical protein
MRKYLAVVVTALALSSCVSDNTTPTFGSVVRHRDETGFYDMRTDVYIEDWGTMICVALGSQQLEQVLLNRPPEIPEYSWGVLVGAAVKERCE